MIKVSVKKSSNMPISSVFVRKTLQKFLKEKGITSDSWIDVSFVSRKKMLELGKKYLGEKDQPPHNVLSFTSSETRGDFVYPPDYNYLGEIVICYLVVVEEAKKSNVRINEKVEELVTHGALHLLGVHHK